MKISRKFFTTFLIFIFVFTPFDFSGFPQNNFSQAQEFEGMVIDHNEVWAQDRTIEEMTAITSGVTVTIEKGTTITFKDNTSLKVNGKLIAKGTVKNPIKFRGENNNANYSITAFNSGEIIMRSADVSGGGVYYSWQLTQNNKNKNFLKKAYAGEYLQGVISAHNPQKLEMENCKIHDNKAGIQAVGNNIKVNRSKFYDNERFDVMGDEAVDFQYNWWGSQNGPDTNKIIGNVDYSPWATEENFHDPVVIVPGILGSWKWTNESEWKLDPIFKTYDKLYDTFDKNGYTPNKDLFTFPYNWRGSNIYSAQLLKDKIQEIKQETNWPKVDIVAHSMGGLLTREYIESDYYQNDIDQLITLGTPHNGAPKDYLMWEGGEFGKGIMNNFFELIFKLEAEENGYENIFDYIQSLPIESVRELLPVYNYLKEADSGDMRQYYNGYPRNEFLENLNKRQLTRIAMDRSTSVKIAIKIIEALAIM